MKRELDIRFNRLPPGEGLVAVGAVAVVAAGGFLSECAPLARLTGSRVTQSKDKEPADLFVLLSYEQRRSFEEALPREIRYRTDDIRCSRRNGEGEIVKEGWNNGCSAWVSVSDAWKLQLSVKEPEESIWRCRMAWALLREAARIGGFEVEVITGVGGL